MSRRATAGVEHKGGKEQLQGRFWKTQLAVCIRKQEVMHAQWDNVAQPLLAVFSSAFLVTVTFVRWLSN